MIRGLESILLSTESAKKLANFYKDVVGLNMGEVMEIGEKGEEGYEFKLKNTTLYIMDHSKVKGKAKNPERVIFNLEVLDIEKEVKRMKEAKAKVIADIYHMQGYGYIATFEDVDGNYFQLVQVRA